MRRYYRRSAEYYNKQADRVVIGILIYFAIFGTIIFLTL